MTETSVGRNFCSFCRFWAYPKRFMPAKFYEIIQPQTFKEVDDFAIMFVIAS